MKNYKLFFSKELLLLIIILTVAFSNTLAQSREEAPNIVFIICDQMRGDAMGAAGNSNARTPHLDALASEGVMFRNNFSNNPVCLPSRVSMFSGQFPSQTGVLCNKHPGQWLDFDRTLPWYFKQAGYRTGLIGKNHCYEKDALEQFDVVSLRGREKFRAYSPFVPPHWHSDILWPEEDCNPGKNTREAIEFINRSTPDQAFFLTVSYFDPHPPYMAPATYTSKYCATDMHLPEYIDPALLGERLAQHQKALHYDRITEYDLKETLRYYHASVEWGVDHQVGKIIEALRRKGIEDNTILVFTADHGDFMGEYHMVRKGMFLYDALLHVPLIWYSPGLIQEGLSPDGLTQNADIFPTLLDLAGIQIPKGLAGRSLKNILQGEEPEIKERFIYAAAAYSDLPENYWESPEPYYNPDSPVPFHTRVEDLTWKPQYHTTMIRTRDWKLIISDTHEPELYRMNGHRQERQNLYGSTEHQEIFEQLKKEILLIR